MSISSGELDLGAAALSGRAPQRIHYFGALSTALAAYGYPRLRQQANSCPQLSTPRILPDRLRSRLPP
ncbi:hypothetical protein, partial [Bradyrhizobium genomosp. III]|uniref:hypothetical protein n=1 Tax=Bradyrhizobium genomosp. III TaxID=2683271 RepID=UPI001AEBE9B1